MWVWLVCVVGGPSPLLAEVPACVFPPLLAGLRCRWCWVFRHSWLRAPGPVPCHSWLGSAGGGGAWLLATPGCGPGCGSPPLLAGVRRPRRWPFPWGWAGSFLWCVCLWRGVCARGVCAGVRVVGLWWWRGCGCVFCVCWCVRVCVWVCGWGRLGLAAGVGVGVVGVCRGWSLATPGGGS